MIGLAPLAITADQCDTATQTLLRETADGCYMTARAWREDQALGVCPTPAEVCVLLDLRLGEERPPLWPGLELPDGGLEDERG